MDEKKGKEKSRSEGQGTRAKSLSPLLHAMIQPTHRAMCHPSLTEGHEPRIYYVASVPKVPVCDTHTSEIQFAPPSRHVKNCSFIWNWARSVDGFCWGFTKFQIYVTECVMWSETMGILFFFLLSSAKKDFCSCACDFSN